MSGLWFAVGCAAPLVWVACASDDASTSAGAGLDASTDADAAQALDSGGARDVQAPDVTPLPDIDAGPMCSPASTFGVPTLVAELDTSGNDSSLRLSADLLTGYFASARDGGSGGMDLWSATRADASSPFSAISPVGELNSPATDTHPSITADGLTLVYESTRGLPSQSIVVAQRAIPSGPFGPPIGQAGLNGFGVVADPFVRSDGQVLYFAAGASTKDLDLYRAFRSKFGFAGVTPVGELSGSAQDVMPTITVDDRRIYFASTRIDGKTKGGFDVWFALRPTLNAPFSAPIPVVELNTADDDFPDFVTPDGCALYFHRTLVRDGGATKAIYVARKPN